MTGALIPDEGILNETLLPVTIVGTEPEVAGLGNDPKVPGRLVPEETPTGKAPEELPLDEAELLFPPEEDALPDELVPGGATDGKGGLDIVRNLTL